MHLRKPAKIALGFFTFLPLLFLIGGFVFVAYQFISAFVAENPMLPLLFFSYLGYVIPYFFLFFLLYLGLGIFYLVHVIRNPAMDTEKRVLWIVVLIAFNGISMPVYWYVHLWKEQPKPKSDPTLEQNYESRTQSQQL
jgi:hypothetical protein